MVPEGNVEPSAGAVIVTVGGLFDKVTVIDFDNVNQRRLNTGMAQPPIPVPVAEDSSHRPLSITYLGQELQVDSIEQQRQIDAETWEHKQVSRL